MGRVGGVLVLILARVYQRSWSYSGQRDYEAILRGVVAIVLLAVVGVAVARPVQIPVQTPHHTATDVVDLPLGVIGMFFLLALMLLVGVRVLARAVHERRLQGAFRGVRKGERGVLIVGAGDGGRLVLREIVRNRQLGLAPVGFLDDDPRKRGMRIDGVRVRGNTEADLPRILEEAEPEEVIIAIPSAPGSTRARVVRECRARAIPVRTLPTVFELLQNDGPGTYRPAGARGARRGRARSRAGRDGARPGGRLPRAGHDRARDRRGRLDRRGAVPPDRARGAAAPGVARPRGGQPLRDPARAAGRAPRAARGAGGGAGGLQGGGADARGARASTAPPWCSTPPPTSTWV